MQKHPENGDILEETRKSKKGDSESRAKPFDVWERADRDSGGMYSFYYTKVAKLYPELSSMEKRIAALIIGINSSREIARKLWITVRTVENHRYNIRCKLGIHSPESLESFLQKK
jgi:AraC family chitin signaling transcriptional activator